MSLNAPQQVAAEPRDPAAQHQATVLSTSGEIPSEASSTGSAVADAPRLPAELRPVLSAATERILPSDDGPGARETGAAEYVERAVERRWNRHFRPLLEQGLGFLQALAREVVDKDFVACSPEEQDEVLRRAQVFPNNDARRFFETLIELTLEGFLCDPSHGGNRDRLGWSYVGYEPPEETAPCGPEIRS
ncbi:MAG: gluconate 2-dehydrogenase subunit 3 family protein [Acidobacteriota bacterium]